MKVLLVNGSYNPKGNTDLALEEVSKELQRHGIETEIFQLGPNPIRDCINCLGCRKDGLCVFRDDVVNDFILKAKEADGYVFGTPVYYAHPSGRILSLLDRAFYAKSKNYAFKPVASVVVARRAGTSTSFDVLNKYATISNMIVVGSSYWNNVFGALPGEAKMDEEGLQSMRNLARNMAYVLKLIELGKKNGIEPEPAERRFRTNFIREKKE